MKHQRLIAAVMVGPMLWLGIGWSNHLAARAARPRYALDAEGIRWQKVVGGTQVTTYLVDRNQPFQQVLEERDGAGNVTASYVYLDDLVAAAFAGVGTRFYGYDGQMSTRFLTDTGANVTDSYTFDAWGVTLSSAGGTPNQNVYTGEQFDPQLGLQYNRARYLSNSTGRWLSRDSVQGVQSSPISLHQYLYSHAQPISLLDESGLQTSLTETIVVVAAAAIMYSLLVNTFWPILSSPAIRTNWVKGPFLTFGASEGQFNRYEVEFLATFRNSDFTKTEIAAVWIQMASQEIFVPAYGSDGGTKVPAGSFKWVLVGTTTAGYSTGEPPATVYGPDLQGPALPASLAWIRVINDPMRNMQMVGNETALRMGAGNESKIAFSLRARESEGWPSFFIMVARYPVGYNFENATDPRNGAVDYVFPALLGGF